MSAPLRDRSADSINADRHSHLLERLHGSRSEEETFNGAALFWQTETLRTKCAQELPNSAAPGIVFYATWGLTAEYTSARAIPRHGPHARTGRPTVPQRPEIPTGHAGATMLFDEIEICTDASRNVSRWPWQLPSHNLVTNTTSQLEGTKGTLYHLVVPSWRHLGRGTKQMFRWQMIAAR